MLNQIICGDAFSIFPNLPKSSIDLVVTSPPYAKQRKNLYEGIAEEDYPQWTVDWANGIEPALTEGASIAIVIRPHVKNGQISDYVLRTRLLMREAGWLECDELIWIKPNSPPMGHTKRPRRSWESILWFSKNKNCFCDPKANGTISDRVGFVGRKGKQEGYINGLTKPEDWEDKKGIARCRDYIEVGTAECDHSKENTHPAQFPVRLAEWLITLLSPSGATVLDPFVGSGSTALACIKTNRNYIGIDCCQEYCKIAENRIERLKNEVS